MRAVRFQVGALATKFEGDMPSLDTLVRRTSVRLAPVALGACLLACGAPGEKGVLVGDSVAMVTVDSSAAAPPAAAGDSQGTAPAPAAASPSATAATGGLRPLADTIAQRLVFVPLVERWLTAAARTKTLYVDLGRVDIDLKKDPARLAAFTQAAAARSPFPVGTPFVVRGAWGEERATLAGFAPYNGRIVGTLDGATIGDSLARVTDPLVASVERVGSPAEASGTADGDSTCDRTATPDFADRLTKLGKAMEDSLRASADQPIYPRLKASLKSRRSQVTGCFGAARGVVVITLYGGDYEWVRERILLVGDSSVQMATIRDLRFRAHEALEAFDADGDGVDDLAARAWTPRGGGTVILRLVDSSPRRFERLASGFAWER